MRPSYRIRTMYNNLRVIGRWMMWLEFDRWEFHRVQKFSIGQTSGQDRRIRDSEFSNSGDMVNSPQGCEFAALFLGIRVSEFPNGGDTVTLLWV